MSDPRLEARGVTRDQVVADLQKVIAHCGGVPGAAEALDIGRSTIYATKANDPRVKIPDVILVALYGPEGGALPEQWQAEPDEGEGVAADGRTTLASAPIEVARIEDERPALPPAIDDEADSIANHRPAFGAGQVYDPRPARALPPELIPANIEAKARQLSDAAAGSIEIETPCDCASKSSPLLAAIDADIEAASARLAKLHTARTLIEELQL